MRVAAIAFFGILSLVAVSPTAGAVPAQTGHQPVVSSLQIVPVAEGCGRGSHWVGGYRGPRGYWHPGHCAPN